MSCLWCVCVRMNGSYTRLEGRLSSGVVAETANMSKTDSGCADASTPTSVHNTQSLYSNVECIRETRGVGVGEQEDMCV